MKSDPIHGAGDTSRLNGRAVPARRAWVALALFVVSATSSLAGRIEVDGRRWRVLEKGKGRPVVVFESGLGDSHEVWESVWPEIASFTRVFLYDRAGLGRSEPGPLPRTSEQMVAELHALLVKAEVPPPYVLVGHSIGGLNMRLFAARFPKEVVGLLLVEATPLDFPEAAQRSAALTARREKLISIGPTGLRSELESALESAEQVRRAGPTKGMRVIVISSSRNEEQREFREIWTRMQREMAVRLEAKQHITTRRSGHYVQYDAPDLVINAIKKITTPARQ